MAENRIYQMSATEIARAVKIGEVTAEEIARGFLSRTQMFDSVIGAWTSISTDYIVAQAARVDELTEKAMLSGVPLGIKDVFNTEYYPTQKGCSAWQGYRAGNDARCVSYLRNHGGIIFGKTDTAELAVHANGKARNPYHLSHVTGSSSGGSAAAVAVGMVPAALGTQTGGSTIRPASWCGVYAMKPSFGLVPRTGVLKTTDTLDTIGYFGRCVDDLELLLEVLRVRGDNFPIQERALLKYRNSIPDRWRIAFCGSHLRESTQDYVRESLERLKGDFAKLKEIELVTVDLPAGTRTFRQLHRRIYHPCLAYYLKSELRTTPEQISKTLNDIFDDAKTMPPEDYAVSLREQTALAAELEHFFLDNKIDLIVTNSSNGSAPLAEPDQHEDLNQLWTMSWLPVCSVPMFKCKKGLPYGLQVVAPKFGDYKILDFLKYLERNGLVPKKSEVIDPMVKQHH